MHGPQIFKAPSGAFFFSSRTEAKLESATLSRSTGLTLVCCPQVRGRSTNNPCALWASQMSSPSSKTAKLRRRSWTFQESHMARNNHQESETARAGVREATERAEDVMQTGLQAAQRVAEEFGRVLGVGGQNE